MRFASFARFASWAIRLPLVAAVLIGTVLLVVESILLLVEGEWLGLLVLVVAAAEVAMIGNLCLPLTMAA